MPTNSGSRVWAIFDVPDTIEPGLDAVEYVQKRIDSFEKRWRDTYPDSGRPLTLAQIDEQLSGAGVPEAYGDRDGAERKSDPDEWEHAEETCAYMAATISGWADHDNVESGRGRHQWLLSQSVRLSCARIIGCISATEYEHAKEDVGKTFRHLRANRTPIKPVTDLEVEAAWVYGTERAATKTEEQARTELGDHKHVWPAPDAPRDVAKSSHSGV